MHAGDRGAPAHAAWVRGGAMRSFALALVLLVAALAAATAPTPGAQAPDSKAASLEVKRVPLPNNAITYDPQSKRIYASVGTSGPQGRQNTLTAIDPADGSLGRSLFVGSEPGGMVLSDQSR